MTLEFTIDTLENLDESIAALYKELDGKFVLDVVGHEKNDNEHKIPKHRLDSEIAKRKAAEEDLNKIATSLKASVPEKFQAVIPDLPAAALIDWIQKMSASGIFDIPKVVNPIDPKKPNSKPPVDLDNLSPQAKISLGFKNK